MATIKATIFLENSYWIATFERTDKKGYAIARHLFGKEPSDAEIYGFVLSHYPKLRFGAYKEFFLQIKRKNPKRMQREVAREMERIKATQRPSTFAQDYLREELEKKKKERKQKSSNEKQQRKDSQFAAKQQKKKEKHRGH